MHKSGIALCCISASNNSRHDVLDYQITPASLAQYMAFLARVVTSLVKNNLLMPYL